LFSEEGRLLGDEDLVNRIGLYPQILTHLALCKRYIIRKFKGNNYTNAPYINIDSSCILLLVSQNKNYIITNKKSSFFYRILSSKMEKKGNMETIYSIDFQFDNSVVVWNSIYNQKLIYVKAPKLAEFNFKIFNNIIPNGYILSKWNKNVHSRCSVCNSIETTEHMIYECQRVRILWNIVSQCLGIDIKFKQIVVGFPMYDYSEKICLYNNVITIVAYCIFKCNMYSKFNEADYINIDLKVSVKKDLFFYKSLLTKIKGNLFETCYYPRLMNSL